MHTPLDATGTLSRKNYGSSTRASRIFVRAQREQFKQFGTSKHTAFSETSLGPRLHTPSLDFHTSTLESHPRLNQGSNCAAQILVQAQREQFKKSGAPKHTALSETSLGIRTSTPSPDFHTPTLELHPRLNRGSNCAAQIFVRAQREQLKNSGASKHNAFSETSLGLRTHTPSSDFHTPTLDSRYCTPGWHQGYNWSVGPAKFFVTFFLFFSFFVCTHAGTHSALAHATPCTTRKFCLAPALSGLSHTHA